jgi:GTPase
VASFKATLEEVKEADLLLNVIDISHPFMEEQMASVLTVLQDIYKGDPYEILPVFNKADLLKDDAGLLRLKREYPESVLISALKKTNMAELLKVVEDRLKVIRVRSEFM